MNPILFERAISLVGIIAVWAIWFYLWKPQRIDVFRQQLFAIRGNLFDLAADGLIPFDHPAYAELRLLANGMIRFAHRATLLTFIIAYVLSKDVPCDSRAHWERHLRSLTPENQDRLKLLRNELTMALARFLILGSPLLLLFIAFRVFMAVLLYFSRVFVGKASFASMSIATAKGKVQTASTQVGRLGADVLEVQVLVEEHRRERINRENAFAH